MMRVKSTTAAIFVALVVSGCATGPDHLFNRPGGQAEALVTDIAECGKIANDVHARAQYLYTNPKAGLAAQGGASFAAGFAQGVEEVRLHNEVVDNCLQARGWSRVALDPVEREKLNATPRTPDARKAFLAEWMKAHPAMAPSDQAPQPVAPSR